MEFRSRVREGTHRRLMIEILKDECVITLEYRVVLITKNSSVNMRCKESEEGWKDRIFFSL
jgi:hypothetical protein